MTNKIQLDTNSLVSIQNNQITTTSKIIANVFEKNHSHVLRDIDNILPNLSNDFCKSNFGFTSEMTIMPRNATRQDRVCHLTKNGVVILIMGYTGEKAMKFKEAYINAFDEMAKQLELQNQPKLQTLENNIKTLEHNNKSLCEVISRYESGLTHAMARELQKHIAITVRLKFNDKSRQSKAYSFIYSKLKDYFSVSKYSEILKTSFGEAKQFVSSLRIPEYAYAEQMDILDAKPKKSNLAATLNDEDAKRAIYVQKVAPQLLQILHSVIDKTETLLIKGSVGRTNFLDSTLQEIKAQSQIVQALLKSA